MYMNQLTASAKEAAALEGAAPAAPGRGGARGAGVGTPPGRAGITGLFIVLGLTGTAGFGPGAGGARLVAGTGAFALRASNSAFQAGTPFVLGMGAGVDTVWLLLLIALGGRGAARLAGGGGGGEVALGATYSSR